MRVEQGDRRQAQMSALVGYTDEQFADVYVTAGIRQHRRGIKHGADLDGFTRVVFGWHAFGWHQALAAGQVPA